MFQSSRKTMKWSSLPKDLGEKVGLSGSQPQPASYLFPSLSLAAEHGGAAGAPESATALGYGSPVSSPARGKHKLELDFKKFWVEFRSSSSEKVKASLASYIIISLKSCYSSIDAYAENLPMKEKETALNMAVDIFCRLVKQQPNVSHLITKLVEVHKLSFVVGRAFVTDVEKLRIYSKGNSLNVTDKIKLFIEVKDGIGHGSNLLHAVEVLVTGVIDKQPLLDSGILCCLIHILSVLLNADKSKGEQMDTLEESNESENRMDDKALQVRQLEIEGSIVHIMKALATHPSAAASLIEDDSLQVLFHMVANGSLAVFVQFKDGLVPFHTIQLQRHAMQILGLLLVIDNGVRIGAALRGGGELVQRIKTSILTRSFVRKERNLKSLT